MWQRDFCSNADTMELNGMPMVLMIITFFIGIGELLQLFVCSWKAVWPSEKTLLLLFAW